LIADIKYGEWSGRNRALKALGEIKDESAVEPLIEFLKEVKHPDAIIALGELKEPRAISLLIEFLGFPYTRAAAASALVQFGTIATEPLIEALKNIDSSICKAAIETLGRLKDPKAIDPLVDLLGTGFFDDLVISALGNIGSPSIKSLVKALRAGNWNAKDKADSTLST